MYGTGDNLFLLSLIPLTYVNTYDSVDGNFILRILFLNIDHYFDFVTACCYVLVIILKGVIKNGFVLKLL